ncbi:MAG TPA: NADH-quinone oxidoreductase subunit C [Dehalococcoidia bacterium]|nr:NADH-quinone oxidoreductase subunit C [Dehalococcoidia bacterium]
MPYPATVTLPGTFVAERIRARVPDGVREVTDGWVVLEPARAYDAMAALRDDDELDGKYLVQLCSVDRITHIEVVYHFSSLAQNHIFEIKVPADHEAPEVPSITKLWIGATLQEREVYDLMGVRFTGHEGLSRLFLWDKFPGHPLRKDFMALPGGQKSGLSQFPKQVPGQTGGEFRPRMPGTGA